MSAHLHRLYGRVVSSPAPLPAPLAHGSPAITIVDAGYTANLPAPAADQAYSYECREDGTTVVTWLSRVQFTVAPHGSLIEVRAVDDESAALTYDYLLAQVLSVALLLQGHEPLHATAVAVNARSIAFLGDCGFGKSTLAAALIRTGARLITDDLLMVDPETLVPQPGARRIKLTEAAARATIGDRPCTPMPDERAKSSYAVRDEEYCERPGPLERVFVLRNADSFAVAPLARAEAFHALLAATFNPLDERPLRLERHMAFAAQLAARGHIAALDVPWDLAQLPAVADLVLANLK